MMTGILKNDLRQGIFERKVMCLAVVGAAAAVTFLYMMYISRFQAGDGMMEISIVDSMLYLFKGMRTYIPSKGMFIIDWQYMLWNILLSVIIGLYSSRAGRGSDLLALVKSGSRSKWFLGKMLWSVITVVFYFIFVFIGIAAGLALGDFLIDNVSVVTGISYNGYIYTAMYGGEISPYRMLGVFIILNFLSYICIYTAQTAITVISDAFFGYVFIVCVLAVSAFSTHWYLIGNVQMLFRYEEMFAQAGNIAGSIMFMLAITAAVCLVGCIFIEKSDLLKRRG